MIFSIKNGALVCAVTLLLSGCASVTYRFEGQGTVRPEQNISTRYKIASLQVRPSSEFLRVQAERRYMMSQDKIIQQLEWGLVDGTVQEALYSNYSNLFSEDADAVGLDIMIQLNCTYRSSAGRGLLLTVPTLSLIPTSETERVNQAVQISSDSGDIVFPSSTVNFDRSVCLSFFPTPFMPPFSGGGDRSFGRFDGSASVRMDDSEFDYIRQNLACQIAAAVASLPEEDRKRLELLHKNKQLLVE